ncbi:hypothetical protein LXL04_004771 [Taraxacum kok-saghyz]
MGASRKLQGEIDRVLKKVQEGVYDTDNANQKEKFEADLKKEIKKLQRYRDQIKTWIQSSEIKDKKALMDARKLIEKEMERFKICEKETKTKAFSKEGLGQQPKTDPKEKAKSETRDWMNNTVSQLESQIDSFEAELEGLSVKKGKARPPRLTHLETSINRHKAHIMKLELILRLLDNDELSPEQVNDVKDFLDDYVDRNQEDFDEFDDVDELYNTLPLDKVESLEDLVTIGPPGIVKAVGSTAAVLTIKSPLSTSAQMPATVTSSIQQGDSVQEHIDEVAPQDNIQESVLKSPSPKIIPVSPSPPTSTPVPIVASSVPVSSPVKGILDNTNTTLSVPLSPVSITTKEEDFSNIPIRKPSPSPALKSGVTNLPSLTIQVTSGISVSSTLTTPLSETARSGIGQPLVSSLNSRMVLPQVVKTSESGGGELDGVTGRMFPSPSGVSGIQWRPGNPFQSPQEGFRGRTEIAPDQREKFLQRFQQVQQQAPKQFTPLQFTSQTSGVPLPPTATSAQQQPSLTHPQSGQHTLAGHVKPEEPQIDDSTPDNPVNETESKSFTSDTPAQGARDVDLSPGQPFGGVIGRRSVSDLGAIGDNLSGMTIMPLGFSHEQQSTLQLLDSAFCKLPQPKDSERARSYTPRTPAVTPQFYPQVQAPIVNNPAFWERLGSDNIGTDTLFFAFYHQQKSYQQYLAAKELKKQSWRYHKKYNTWFQRHEEPKVATDDYEQGTYVYFDFHIGTDELQNGWYVIISFKFTFLPLYIYHSLSLISPGVKESRPILNSSIVFLKMNSCK